MRGQKKSTKKFVLLNFNLKKIIFSYLEVIDQKKIYWLNKKLRPLLPDSPVAINILKLNKTCSYKFDSTIYGLLELQDLQGETLKCWITNGIRLLKFNRYSLGKKSFLNTLKSYFKSNVSPTHLELIRSVPMQTEGWTYSIQQENGNMIFGSYIFLRIFDKNFKLIENFEESNNIYALCNISDLTFAVALVDGIIKIYSKNLHTQKYEVKEYKFHSFRIWSLIYLPKFDYLLSGSYDLTIHVFSLSQEKSIARLRGHSRGVYSLIALTEDMFASGSYSEIKIWSIEEDASIECIYTIITHENLDCISLHLLGSNYMISSACNEFKIWSVKNWDDLETLECLKTYNEDSNIKKLIVTKNGNIITSTSDKKVNVWQLLV